MYYRRHNDLNAKTFDRRVQESLKAVNRRHVHMFERRARAYRHCLSDPKNDTFELLEKALKKNAQATKHSNNTAELTGILQAIIHLEREAIEDEKMTVICSDSKYGLCRKTEKTKTRRK